MLLAPLWLIPAVRRLHLSLRFPGPNLVFQVVAVQVAVAQEEAATPNRCCCYLLPGSYMMPVALEAAPLRPQGDVSCAEALPLPVPWRPEQNGRGLAPVARALQLSSSRLLSCGNDTVLNDPPLVLRPALALSVYPNCSKSVRRNGARRTCRNSCTNGSGGSASCGCNTSALIPTLPPSSSSPFGVNSLPCASSDKLPVHRSPSFP